MDKIWDRKSIEVEGHWPPLWGAWKNLMTTQNRLKSNAKKIRRITNSKVTQVHPSVRVHQTSDPDPKSANVIALIWITFLSYAYSKKWAKIWI